MRPGFALALVLLVPAAAADGDACGFETTQVSPSPHAGLFVETRDCDEARSYEVGAQDPAGRTELRWYDDERGVGLEVFRPPRYASWTEGEHGCAVEVYLFGAIERGCDLGAPPSPFLLP